VHAGPAAYSSLAGIGKRAAGLLYERGDTRPYERITFIRFGVGKSGIIQRYLLGS
jgi:hypothetical protein